MAYLLAPYDLLLHVIFSDKVGSWPLLVIVVRGAKHTVHTSIPMRVTRGHDLLRLSWPTWLRSHSVRLCRRTRAGRLGRLGAWSTHEAAAEGIKARATNHLTFQHFETIDMAIDRAGRPGQGHPRFDRRIVVPEPVGKALQGLQRTSRRALQPGLQRVRLPLAHELGKVLREVHGLGDRGLLLPQLDQLVRFGLRALRLTPQHQPRGPAGR